MLKPFSLISALFLLPAITPGSSAAPPAAATGQDSATPKPSAVALDKAKKIYAVDCAMCHGDNGNGKTDLAKDMTLNLDDWTNPAILSGKPDKQLFDMIRNGKDKMPSEDVGRAGDNDVRALIYYIRNFSKGQTAPPAPPADTAPAAPAAAPTAEVMFSTIESVEALSAGTDSDAITPVSADLIEWADLILVMERTHFRRLQGRFANQLKNKRISVLRIRDDYDYMDPDLIRILREKVTSLLKLQAPSLK